jgi:hypothetical protein
MHEEEERELGVARAEGATGHAGIVFRESPRESGGDVQEGAVLEVFDVVFGAELQDAGDDGEGGRRWWALEETATDMDVRNRYIGEQRGRT